MSEPGSRDIVDEIDALVDWQLSKYSDRSGYDHNVNQAKCPHEWCDADFHGLPITRRMHTMRLMGRVDPDYRYGEDTSPVLCPGSTFDGEFEPPAAAADDYLRVAHGLLDSMAAVAGLPPLSHHDLSSNERRLAAIDDSPGPRWWRCDDIRRRRIDLRDSDSYDTGWSDSPLAGLPFRRRDVLYIDGREIPLLVDRTVNMSARIGSSDNGARWMEVHCEERPPGDGWYLRDTSAILSLHELQQLQNLRVTVAVANEVAAEQPDVDVSHFECFRSQVREWRPELWVSSADILVCRVGRFRDLGQAATRFELRWQQPTSDTIEFRGGPAHGQTRHGIAIARFDEICVPQPVRLSFRDFDGPVTPTVDTVEYVRSGWNTVTNAWVFEPKDSHRNGGVPGWAVPTVGWTHGVCSYCEEHTRVNFHALCWRCQHELRAEWDTADDSVRHIIIASRAADARRYARRHSIMHPVVVDLDNPVPDAVLRGIGSLDGYRVHEIAGGLVPPHVLERLRMLAHLAGRPLESFYTTTTSEQAA